ncbi:MAG TPA: hypothetical protein VJ864_08165, partial [Candidatus Binatia bacterium]|nr:hypothetical protein [Candidatus Binatia bacterium]
SASPLALKNHPLLSVRSGLNDRLRDQPLSILTGFLPLDNQGVEFYGCRLRGRIQAASRKGKRLSGSKPWRTPYLHVRLR